MIDEYLHPPDADSAEFIRAQLAGFICMADLAARQIGSKEDALHDFRVALRALHSWLKAFVDTIHIETRVIRDISNLADATNRCRDMEVFDQWLHRQITHKALKPTLHYVSLIHDQLEQDRRSSIGRISTHWPAIKNSMQQALKPTGHSNAKAAFIHHVQPVLKLRLSRLSDQVSQIISAKESKKSQKKLHKCRITIKQMRYLLEPFKAGNSHCKQSVHDLKRLQDQLGTCHDLFVFTATLQQAIAQYANLDTLIESAERQRRNCFADLHAHYFTPPMAWLTRLEAVIITDESMDMQQRQR